MPLFIKSEVGMLLRDFSNQVGMPNGLHFDISVLKWDRIATSGVNFGNFTYSGGPQNLAPIVRIMPKM